MYDQISACTDKSNDFLNLHDQSIKNESHEILPSNVEEFLIELDSRVKDITDIYKQLSDVNKNSSDTTYQTVYSDFITDLDKLKANIEENKAAELELSNEEQRLEDAKRELKEKLKLIQQKRKALRDRVAITSRNRPQPVSISEDTSDISSPSSNRDLHSPQQDIDIQSNKERIKNFTRELTSGLAETLGSKEIKERKLRTKKAVEPDIFTGNPIDFNDWEIDWEAFVEAEDLTEKEALRHIKKFLSGKAKDCVVGLLSVNTAEAYRQVRRKLKTRFSTDQDIAGIFKKKLRQWPPIREPNGEKLLEFADFLDHIQSSRSSVKGLNSLDEKEQNEFMSQKLPHDIKLKWVEIINHKKLMQAGYPSFSDFVEFVQVQADTYMNPIMKRGDGKNNQKQNTESKSANQHKPANKSYHTSTSDVQAPKGPYCYLCQDNSHSTPNCGALAKKNYKEKMEFVSTNKLCYRCAKHKGLAKNCRSNPICEVCGKGHATILHNSDYRANTKDKTQESTSSNSNNSSALTEPQNSQASTKSTTDKNPKKVKCTTVKRATYSMVVPVYVSAGGIEKLVYAVLDTASDSCYIDNRVANAIGADGVKEDITMVTMNAETKQCIQLYKDLHIRGYLTNSSTFLNAFESNAIACSKTEILTRNSGQNLPHVQKIASHLPPQLDIPVGLLIGGDCPQAIFPKESVEGPTGEPFAVKTMFGWTLCGGKPEQVSAVKQQRTRMNQLLKPFSW